MKISTKNIVKVLSVLVIILTIVSAIMPVFAATSFAPNGWEGVDDSKLKSEDAKSWIASVMTIVAMVGSGIAVIALIILGIKYMMGSVEEKAEYKKTLLPYVIGALFVFGASAIVGFISQIPNNG